MRRSKNSLDLETGAVSTARFFRRLLVSSPIALAALSALVWAGCVEPSIRDGQFACAAADDSCPPGFQCGADGLCVRDPGAVDEVDAGEPIEVDAGDPPMMDQRVPGALVLYLFDEGSGAVVNDQSGNTPPLHLAIDVPSNVTWDGAAGTMTIDTGETIIKPPEADPAAASNRLRDALKSSNAFTVEAWVTPAADVVSGPQRIVTLSLDNSIRSFTVGQGGGSLDTFRAGYVLRLRTEDFLANNGTPGFETPDNSARTQLTHVVYTRSANGDIVCYLDGVAAATVTPDRMDEIIPDTTRTGDFGQAWPADHVFGLGNEITGARQWLGTMHLVAVYDRVLSPLEVKDNFDAGSDPEVVSRP